MPPLDDTDATIERWAARRMPPPPAGLVAARRERERRRQGRLESAAAHPLRHRGSPHWLVPKALALGGIAAAARRNALDIALVRRALSLPGLPDAFAGFRVLQVSDPHFGADPALDAAIVASVRGVEHDLCVMTGDYRFRSFGPIDEAVSWTRRLRDALDGDADPLAVLGNHDPIALAPPLEAAGLRVLLNESVTLRRGDAALHVVGVDDTRCYRLHDLARALGTRPDAASDTFPRRAGEAGRPSGRASRPSAESATLLLAHSPEIAEDAASAGCGAYLCGHTHGGQICLPGGTILMRNARAPAARLSGAWRLGAMSGYTSRGVGVSIAVARFNCPPEITLHVLERADGSA